MLIYSAANNQLLAHNFIAKSIGVRATYEGRIKAFDTVSLNI